MPTLVHAAVKGSPLVSAGRAVPVVIGIMRDARGKPDGLFVRSGNHAEPTVYWAPVGEHVKSSHGLEVLWVCVDLRKGDSLHIGPKAHQAEYFESSHFELDDHHCAVATGPVDPTKMVHKQGKQHEWSYNVVLESDHPSKPLTLDPTIIIVREP